MIIIEVNRVISILNILLYLIPITVLQYLLYRAFAKSGRLKNVFYLMLYLLPLVLLVLSVDYLSSVFSIDPYLLQVLHFFFYIGLILYIIVLIKRLLIGKKYFKDIARIHKKNIILAIVALTIPFVSIFFINVSDKMDLSFYWAISTMLILVSMYAAYFNKKLINLSAAAIVLLYADFTARVISTFQISSKNVFGILSSILGMIGTILVLYEGYLFVLGLPRAHYVEKAHRWHKTAMKVATLIMVVISILVVSSTTIAINDLHQYRTNKELSVQNDLGKLSKSTANSAANFLDNAYLILKDASDNKALYGSFPEKSELIKSIYESTKEKYFSSITLVNNKGIIVFTYPYKSAIGKNISNQAHVKKILTEHLPVVSSPIKTVQGFPALVIHYPLFYNNKFIGSIAGLIDISRISEILANKVVNDSLHPFAVLTENKIVVASTDPEYPPFSSVAKLVSPSERKELFYAINFFRFINATFSVETRIPKASTYSAIRNEEKKQIGILLSKLAAIFLVLYLSIWLIHLLDAKLGAAVEEAVQQERKEKEKSASLSKRLFALSAFLKDLSIAAKEETFYNELLKIAIKTVPNAQKGSVGIKKGKELYFVSAYGYNFDLLRKLKLPFEKEKSVVKGYTVRIFNHIDKTDPQYFSEDGIALMKKIGNYGIKSTLISPLYIEKNYIGSIFLDNFESEDAFTEEDKKIAMALSNIASVFTEAQRDLKRVKISLIGNLVLSKLAEALSQSKEENIAVAALNVLRSVVSNDICFFAVAIPKDDKTLIYFSDNKHNDVIKMEKQLLLPDKIALVNPEELKFIPVCGKTKEIFTVPYKGRKNSVIFYGFSTENIDEGTLTISGEISDRLYDILSNVHLQRELGTLYTELLISLVNSIDLKDRYTKFHSERVTIYAYLIGKELNLPRKKLITLFYASILHDVGKIGIPDSILNKSGKLSKEEFEEIKKHPVIGADMVGKVEFLKEPSEVLRHHHERYDGRGYPDGLEGENIPFLSRIISVADAFDAMASTRSYRPGMTIEKTLSIIEEESGKQFDPKIASVFVKFVREHREVIEEIIKNPDAIAIYKKLSEET